MSRSNNDQIDHNDKEPPDMANDAEDNKKVSIGGTANEIEDNCKEENGLKKHDQEEFGNNIDSPEEEVA